MTLDAVRLALQHGAAAERDEILAAADRVVAERLESAWHEADELRSAAQAEGAAEARSAAANEVARARREARRQVLRAECEEYEQARDATRAAVRELRSDSRYPVLLEVLTAQARAQLGNGTVVSVDETDGGVVASSGTRSVDYRLPEVATRLFDAAGPEVKALWR